MTAVGDVVMLNPTTDVYPINSVDTPDETSLFEVEDVLDIENDQDNLVLSTGLIM